MFLHLRKEYTYLKNSPEIRTRKENWWKETDKAVIYLIVYKLKMKLKLVITCSY